MQFSSAAKPSDNPSDYPSGNLGDNPSDYSSMPVVLQLINARVQRKRIGMGILLLLLLICAYVGLTRGSLPIDIEQQLRYFISGANTVENTSANTTHWYVLSEIRLPRVIMTMLIGALLAVSGCAMQGLVRNPLADPGLIGIAGGAAAAAALSMTIVPPLLPALESVWVAMWAFGGALVSVWTVLRFSNGPQGVSVAALILAGVAINALTGTVIGAISYVASDDALRQISYWTMGSLAGASWTLCGLVALASFIAITGLMKSRNALNLMALGEKEAAYMGLNVTRYKHGVLWLVAFSVALATALCGIIGFVGLVVPHMCRAIFGVNHQVLIPASALTGALLLIVADTLARTLFVPMEIPIGIVTSAVGAPFFLYLLWQQRRIFSGGV